jgi:hypothetical protein
MIEDEIVLWQQDRLTVRGERAESRKGGYKNENETRGKYGHF